MSQKKQAAASSRRPFWRMQCGFLSTLLVLGALGGCSTVHNPAKRLVNHIGTKTSEARMRKTVENDRFPTAKEAGLE
jgi:hypothetical protein